jgi:hypothetical protein
MLEQKLKELGVEPTVKSVGQYLCGVNWELAKRPRSTAFLNNIQYNGESSFYPLVWLLKNIED